MGLEKPFIRDARVARAWNDIADVGVQGRGYPLWINVPYARDSE